MERGGKSSRRGKSLRANDVSGPGIKKKQKVLKKASKCLPVIVPEQLSQAVMSLGPISKTALSVRLVR